MCHPPPPTTYVTGAIPPLKISAPSNSSISNRNTTLLSTVCVIGENRLFLLLYKHLILLAHKIGSLNLHIPPQILPLRRTCFPGSRPIWQNPICQMILLPDGQFARLLRMFLMFSFYVPAGAHASVSPALLSAGS